MTLLEQYIKIIAEAEENKGSEIIDAFEYFIFKFTLSLVTYTIKERGLYKACLPYEIINDKNGNTVLHYGIKNKISDVKVGSTELLGYNKQHNTIIVSRHFGYLQSIMNSVDFRGIDSNLVYAIDFEIFKRFIKIAKRYSEFDILCKTYSKK